MRLADLAGRRVLILGVGVEGSATYRALRAAFPEQPLARADRLGLDELPADIAGAIAADPRARFYSGGNHLAAVDQFEIVIKAPGIPADLPELERAAAGGLVLTSHTALFLAECPGTVVGVTGTKGKSTTSSLTHAVLRCGGRDCHLVGNIGNPPLSLLSQARPDSVFVFELSSYQLEGLTSSPGIAVLLGIVPDHLGYHGSFERYVQAKSAITRFQGRDDFLVYDADSPTATAIARDSLARSIPCSRQRLLEHGAFVRGADLILRDDDGGEEVLLSRSDIPLLGDFNLTNVLAALAVARVLEVPRDAVQRAVRSFEPLEHRFECVGTFGGITFYNAALSTVPEVTIAHLEALGPGVQTVLLGGYDRQLDFGELARQLVDRRVRTLILFPTTGARIWRAVEEAAPEGERPQAFFVESMEDAVRLAFEHTPVGSICLHSPASPSFGLFRDYRERGSRFKESVRRLGSG